MEKEIKEILKKYPKSFIILNKDDKEITAGYNPLSGMETLLQSMEANPTVAATIGGTATLFFLKNPELEIASKRIAESLFKE